MRERPIPLKLIRKWLEVAPMPTTNVIVMRDAYVLLVRRKNPPEEGKWFTPGGILVKGINVALQALEILEDETGIKATNLALLLVDDEFFSEGYGTRDVHLVTVVYKHNAETSNVKTNIEHTDIKWFPITALPHDLHPNVRKWILEAVREAMT